MEPFPTPELVWEPAETRWHVYVLPHADDGDLARLLERTAEVAVEVAGESLVPVGAFAHATVHMISQPSAGLPDGSVTAFAKELHAALAEFAPFSVTAGGPCAGTGSVTLDVDGDLLGGPWAELTERVGGAIKSRFGSDALRYQVPPPHISVAYCAESTDSGRLQSALRRRVRPSRAEMRVQEVWLLDVRQDAHAHTYTWPERTAVKIPLGRVRP
jgi:hypothetical protein